MAAIKDYFTQALMIIKNGKGRITTTQTTWFEVDYDSLRDMINDAQFLNEYGYNTCMNRKIFTMTVSMGM